MTLFNVEKYKKETLKAVNALFDYPTAGVVQTVDTITDILQGVVEAKYYELAGQTPSDFVDIQVGRGAYMGQLFQFTSEYVGAPFEQCIINPKSTGIHNDAVADIAVDGINIPNNFYRQKYSISQEELKMAAANRIGFDVIEQKEKSRAKNWQLGIQNVLFNGLGDGRTFGLNTQTGVTTSATLLPKAIEKMSAEQIRNFAGAALATAFANSNYTVMPNRWLMPTRTYLALGVPFDTQFAYKTLREVLEDAFKQAGAPADFKIVHSMYNNTAASGLGLHAFYNTEDVVMYIPKDYTPHPLFAQGALDMISDAEGQFTGVWVKRPGAFLYAAEQA